MNGASSSTSHPADGIKLARKPRRISYLGWSLLAVALGGVVVAIFYVPDWLRPMAAIERLTCAAYAQNRVLEPRLIGCTDYPEMGAQSSDRPSEPVALLEADARIARGIEAHPDDAQWLHLQGRADLLVFKVDAAIAELDRAHALLPADTSILSDLGSAWYQKAARSDRQPSALFSRAYDYYSQGRVLNPQGVALLFNQGLAAERIFAFRGARDAWEQYLRMDSKSAWAKEARQHLAQVGQKLEQQQAYVTATRPEALLAELRRGIPWDQHLAPDEEYLTVAVTHLLPRYYGKPADEEAGRILRSMAEAFVARHQDPWIRDVLRTPHGPKAAKAFAALAEAVVAKDSDDWDRSLSNSNTALNAFAAIGGAAGGVRAEFETLYSTRIRSTFVKECLQADQAIDRMFQGHSYPWLEAQALLEGSLCAGWSGDFEQPWLKQQAAIQSATRHHYGVLLLRAVETHASWQADMGNLVTASQDNMQGLALYWTARYPLLRGFALYIDLGLLNPQDHASYSAAAWVREAAAAISALDRPLFQAATLHLLALKEMSVKLQPLADQHLRQSDAWVAKMSNVDRARLRVVYSIDLAETEASLGEVDRPLARLEGIRGRVEGALLNLRFNALLGRLHLRRGNLAQARTLLAQALEMGEAGRAKLSTADRLPWTHAMGDVYRALVECDVRNVTAPSASWQLWSRYKAALFDETPAQNLALPPLAPGEAMLSVAELPSGVVAWLRTQNGFYFRWLDPPARTVRDVAARFVRACANPHAPVMVLRSDAQQLSRILLGPWENELRGVHTLAIESDGPISTTAWPALVLSNGHYWSEDFAIRVRVAVHSGSTSRHSFSSLSHALAVGEPAVTGESDLPPLPDAKREAQWVATLFRKSETLLGKDAVLNEVRKRLPAAEIFHFAGHAYGSEGGGLVLRGNAGGPALLRASEIQGISLSRCRLAVLSACATGSGERDGPGDPQSLVRAFLRAGAGEVLASLWNLDSAATQIFMNEFYGGIISDASVEQAMRRAAAAVRSNSAYRHPYYWAALQVFDVR